MAEWLGFEAHLMPHVKNKKIMASKSANTTEAPHVQLPDAFRAEMEDGTPVTSQNLLAYLAEYVEEEGILPSLARAVVAGFSDDAGFQQLAQQQRKSNNEMLQYLFCERNYSKRRACFIVDLMAVRVIFDAFSLGSGTLIVSSGKLAEHWDQEKVEVCMCLKKFMCPALWKLIGAQLSKIDDEDFSSIHASWTEENNEDYGCCLQRTILGPGRPNFLTTLRDAWTTPLEHVMFPHSCLNVLYPRASVLWQPPK